MTVGRSLSPPIPFIGGKRAVGRHVVAALADIPAKRVVVPFFGAGGDSLLFASAGRDLLLGDGNAALITLMRWLRRDPGAVVESAHAWVCETGYDALTDEKKRYEYRRLVKRFNRTTGDLSLDRAWLYFVVQKCCYNGLCRFNQHGQWNSPWGRSTNARPWHWAMVHAFGLWLRSFPVPRLADYRDLFDEATPDDLVYCDPPYMGGFDRYTGHAFNHDDLFAELRKLTARGVTWAMSNAPAARGHFPRAQAIFLDRGGQISSQITARQKVKEVLLIQTHAN